MIDAIWPDPGLFPDFGSAGSGGTYTMGGSEGIYTMGDVLNQGLYAMIQNFWDNNYTFELFHYFGDPAMKIWTADPNETHITATHDNTIDCTENLFTVSGSEAYGTATLVCNNKLIGETLLDASGNGTISYALETAGQVLLTVSKHNCVPYIASLTQICAGYPPEVATIDAVDIEEYSAKIGGDILNDYSNPVIESGVLFSTDPLFEMGQPGVVQLHTSPMVANGTFEFDISGLQAATTYYFMAYASNAMGTSYSDKSFFTTLSDLSIVPIWNEDFENGGFIPDGWTQEQINSSGANWTFVTGNGTGHPSTAHGGVYNACLRDRSSADSKTRLISPQFDLTGLSHVSLIFWHTQEFWSPDQDLLTVSYRTSSAVSWIELETYTSSISAWTEEVILLPETSSEFYICFEGNAKYGYGVCVDDVLLQSAHSSIPNTRSLSNIATGTGDAPCYGAQQTITVAGNGNPVDFLDGSSVNLIAGESISFLPGFHAHSNSYMDAWITTTGSFCDALPEQAIVEYTAPMVHKSENIEREKLIQNDLEVEPSMKVYPNPTQGQIKIELGNIEGISKLTVTNSSGVLLYKTDCCGKYAEIEIPEIHKGICFISLTNGKNVLTQKLIVY